MPQPYSIAVLLTVIAVTTACGSSDSQRRWQPAEIDGIEFLRTLMTLEPGSVVLLDAGTYPTISLPAGVGLRGSGVDQTKIVVPLDQGTGVLLDASAGTVELANLTVSDAAAPDGPLYGRRAVAVFGGDAIVENVRIGPFTGTGIALRDGNFTVRDVSIADCSENGLRLEAAGDATLVERLQVRGTVDGFDLDIGELSSGTFRELDLSEEGYGAIAVKGVTSIPEFPGLDPDIAADILFEDGALPRDSITDADREALRMAREEADFSIDFNTRNLQLSMENARPVRRELARRHLAAIAGANGDPVAEQRAVESFLRGLLETRPIQGYDPQGDFAVYAELRWLYARHGATAAAALLRTLPTDEAMVDEEFYLRAFDEGQRSALASALESIRREEARSLAMACFADFRSLLTVDADTNALATAFLSAAQRYLKELSGDTFGEDRYGPLNPVFDEFARDRTPAAIAELLHLLPLNPRSGLPGKRQFLAELPTETRRTVSAELALRWVQQRHAAARDADKDFAPVLRVESGHSEKIEHMLALADGSLILTAEDRHLRIWERGSGRHLREFALSRPILGIYPAPQHRMVMVATANELQRICLITLEPLEVKRASGGVTWVLHDPDDGLYYALQHGRIAVIDPTEGSVERLYPTAQRLRMADGKQAPKQTFENGRLLAGPTDSIILALPTELWQLQPNEGILTRQRTFPQAVAVAELDADRLVTIRMANRAEDSAAIEVAFIAKDDFRTLGSTQVAPAASERGHILRPAAVIPAANGSGPQAVVFTFSELLYFSTEGDVPQLINRTAHRTPADGYTNFSMAAFHAVASYQSMPTGLLLAGSAQRRIGSQAWVRGALLVESATDDAPAGPTVYGRLPLQPVQLWTHPQADEFYVRSGEGLVRRIQVRPEGLQVTAVGTPQAAVRFTPDGRWMAGISSSAQLTLQPLDPRRPTNQWPQGRMLRPPGSFYATDWTLSPDGERIAVLSATKLTVISTTDGKVLYETAHGHFAIPGIERGSVAFSADGRYLAYYSVPRRGVSQQSEPAVQLLDLEKQQIVWKAAYAGVSGLRFLGSTTLAFASGRTGFHLLDAATGNTLQSGFAIPSVTSLAAQPRLLTYSRDNRSVAMAADDRVFLFDAATAQRVASLPRLGVEVLSLAFFTNPDFLLIGTADGKIRLWRLSTTSELAQLALFVEDQEWVLSTPDLLFQGSVAAQQRVYFTRGTQTLPLSSLFESFHTPRLLERLLAGETLSPLIPPDALRLPPTVAITVTDRAGRPLGEAPPEGGEVRVRVDARSERVPIAEIRLYHNGKLVSARQRGLVVEDDEPAPADAIHQMARTYPIGLLDGVNEFRAIAINAQRTESEPVQLALDAGGVVEQAAGLRLHLVAVGINTYDNSAYSLNYAVSDARAFAETVARAAAPIVGRVETTLLLDADASRESILRTLEAIAERADARDVLIFYYAGHGVMSGGMQADFFLAPAAVTQLYGNDEMLAVRGVSAGELRDLAARIPARKQLFVLDACQSAGALDGLALRGAAEERAIAQLARSTGTHWITASGSEQFAVEFEQLGHGAFTYSILEAFRTASAEASQPLTVRALDAFVQSRVPELTREHRGTPQFPASYGFGQDFPIGLPLAP